MSAAHRPGGGLRRGRVASATEVAAEARCASTRVRDSLPIRLARRTRPHPPSLAQRCPCTQSGCVSISITVRNVPSEVRDALASRAAASGRSLYEYLAAELSELATRPSVAVAVAVAVAEARAQARHYPPVDSARVLMNIEADRK